MLFAFRHNAEIGGDSRYYLELGWQLSRDLMDCRNPNSFWPATPAMDRASGWPFLLSLGMRLFPSADGIRVLRLTGAALNVLTALMISVIAEQLTRRPSAALGAGLARAVNLVALSLVEGGWSEPAFVAVTLWRRSARC